MEDWNRKRFIAIDAAGADLSSISRRVGATTEQLAEAVVRNQFLISAHGPPPGSLASLESLARAYGHLRLATTMGRTSISTLAASLGRGESHSTMVGNSTEVPEELFLALNNLRPFRAFRGSYLELFLGGPGSGTSLHRDEYCGLCVNLFGRKRWWVFPPQENQRLGPIETLAGFQRSALDPRTQDGLARLRARGARWLELIAEPGEVWVVPLGWFHFVVALEPSLSVRLNLPGPRFQGVTSGGPLLQHSG
jgi:hypothetical protein